MYSPTYRTTSPLRRIRLSVMGICLLALLTVQFGPAAPTAHAEATAIQRGLYTEYAVPNGPLNLAVEAPGIIWFTAPDADAIGAVVRISAAGDPAIRYRVDYVGFADNSEPYDLDYADGAVWFTLRGTGQIGRIDTATRAVQLYTIPTPDSRPTGIDIAPDGQVWYAGNAGQIGKFDPASSTFTEYVFPDDFYLAPRVEQLRFQNSRSIWFSQPDNNSVGNFNSVTGEFYVVPTSQKSPIGLSLDNLGRLWITAAGSSSIGRYAPGTLTIWAWYNAPTPGSNPAGITTFDTPNGREVWFAQNGVGSLGRLQISGFSVTRSEAIPLAKDEISRPWGVGVDSDSKIWVADTARNVLIETKVPIRYYLPKIAKP